MRIRFFFISLVFLLITALSITSLLAFYYRSERLSFLDDQIRETATSIVDSRISEIKTTDYSQANSIISDELGPDRIGKFFIIRTDSGDILFQTESIRLLGIQVPRSPTWVTIDYEDKLIRVLNLKLPRVPNRTLQVGLVTDSNFLFWSTLTSRTIMWLVGLLSVLLIITLSLSGTLFAPVRHVGRYLKYAQSSLEMGRDVPPLPEDFKRYMKKRRFTKYDEFAEMLTGIQQLGTRVNLNTKFTRSWTFQMAHELKTPLTILNRDLEDLALKHKFSDQEVSEVDASMKRISNTITNFLNWADVASTQTPTNLHVIRIGTIVSELMMGWSKIADGRLQVKTEVDFQVMCNPFHLSHLLDNLVSNALKYSPQTVEINIQNHTLQIRDRGPGIPPDVLERIGSPFNKGPSTQIHDTGSGLGLAWVQTIVDLYGWRMRINATAEGTTVEITFPNVSANA